MHTYEYDYTDFANDIVSISKLTLEIAAASLGQALVDITANGDTLKCAIQFEAELDSGDKTTLDGIVASHDGVEPTQYKFHAASTLVHAEVDVTETTEWQVLGGVVTTPSFFCKVVSKLLARIIGSVKSQGDGLELRVMENGTTAIASASYDSTGGVWTQQKFYSSSAPTDGTNEYTLEARLNTATSGSVRFFSMSLLEALS